MEATFFDRLDQDQLARVVTPVGMQMAIVTAAMTRPMLDDDSISPAVLIAGIVKVHALGVASALFGARALSDGDPAKADLVREELLQAAIATIRAELLAPGVADGTVQ